MEARSADVRQPPLSPSGASPFRCRVPRASSRAAPSPRGVHCGPRRSLTGRLLLFEVANLTLKGHPAVPAQGVADVVVAAAPLAPGWVLAPVGRTRLLVRDRERVRLGTARASSRCHTTIVATRPRATKGPKGPARGADSDAGVPARGDQPPHLPTRRARRRPQRTRYFRLYGREPAPGTLGLWQPQRSGPARQLPRRRAPSAIGSCPTPPTACSRRGARTGQPA